MRNCRTRPVSWRFVKNMALNEVVHAYGYEAFWVFMGIVTSVDNAGRMEGGRHLLRDLLFPLKTEIEPQKVSDYILGLCS